MAPNPRDQKWYSLADQSDKETDQTKLLELISLLCSALDDARHHTARPYNGKGSLILTVFGRF